MPAARGARGGRGRAFVTWRLRGFRDGAAWRAAHPEAAAGDMRAALHDHVRQAFAGGAVTARTGASAVLRAARAYGNGFMNGAGFFAPDVPVPLQGTAEAVVCAGGDEAALEAVLEQLDRLPLRDWVVVLPGDAHAAEHVARRFPRSVLVRAEEPLPEEAGRALGAGKTDADIVLFVDGGQPVPAEALAGYLLACDGGADVALNGRAARAAFFHRRPREDRLNEFLNLSLGRPDLGARTLAALPFALSRRALEAIGAALAVPLKAHALAVLRGLRFGAGPGVPWRTKPADGRERFPAGDHLEAWRAAMAERGGRLSFPDRWRNRAAAEGTVP